MLQKPTNTAERTFAKDVTPLVRNALEQGTTPSSLSQAFAAVLKSLCGSKETSAEIGLSRLLADGRGTMTINEAAAHLRVPSARIRGAIQRGDIVAVHHRRRVMIPRWQFRRDGSILPGLPEVVRSLTPQRDDPVKVITFFVNPNARLRGHRPVDVLRSGTAAQKQLVLRLAVEAAYDDAVAEMQTQDAKAAISKLFASTPAELGSAAVECAKREFASGSARQKPRTR